MVTEEIGDEEVLDKRVRIKKNTELNKETKIHKIEMPSKKKFVFIATLILVVLLVALLGYSRYQLYKMKDPGYQQRTLEEQTQKIITNVSALIDLPEGTPQIATVADVDTLKKTQPFFDKATNGDEVLIFTNEAILYSPSKNKIINVAPVNHEQSTVPKTTDSTAPATSTTTPSTKIGTTKTTTTKSSIKN